MREEHICDECFFNVNGVCRAPENFKKTDHECEVCGESDECYYYNKKVK